MSGNLFEHRLGTGLEPNGGGAGGGSSPGIPGPAGKSAYELAVQNGFAGTLAEWLASLEGGDGKSAYELAVLDGFTGTQAEWLASLKGGDGEDFLQYATEPIPAPERGADGERGERGEDAPRYASEPVPVPEGAEGTPGRDGEDALQYASEPVPVPESVKGDKGDSGEDALFFATEPIPVPAPNFDLSEVEIPDNPSYASEPVPVPEAPQGEPGRDGEDFLQYASEPVPVPGNPTAGAAQYSLHAYKHEITAADVTAKYFDVAPDFPDAAVSRRHSAVMIVNTDAQAEGVDFEIVGDGSGKPRRVSWDGLGLENDPPMTAGWTVTVIYHARIWDASGVGEQGPPGERGEDGNGALQFASEPIPVPAGGQTGGALRYEHTQSVPAAVWNVRHNLGAVPVFALTRDAAGEQIAGFADYAASDADTLVISFSEPVAGSALILG
jgi:hypothetical protein